MAKYSLNGASFIDAGGSTLTVKKIKPLTPNLILPNTQAEFDGTLINIKSFPVDFAATGNTLEIYDWNGVLKLSLPILNWAPKRLFSNCRNRGLKPASGLFGFSVFLGKQSR
jgi:hypothetical protein